MNEPRRQRRTKADIEKSINDAAHGLIARKGFADVRLTEITRSAGIEPVVFYNRYKNLNEFYSEFVKRYDYWLTDVIKQQGDVNTVVTEENCASILDGLVSQLVDDKIMQEILRWEIASGNDVTERAAIFREMLNMQLVLKYKKLFREQNSPIDIAAFAAIIIGGIYYLFLHKDRSTFCGLDLNDPADIATIRQTISRLTHLVFGTLNNGFGK